MSDQHHPRRTRLALAALTVFAALAALLAAPAAPAAAKPAETWGFAYNDQPNPAPGYVMPPSRQWGSWKTAFPADWATVTKVGVGIYQVRFPHIAGRGIVHVTAVNYGPTWCQVAKWGASGGDEIVYVRCHSPGGAPKDSAFTVLYTDSFGGPAPGAHAWVAAMAAGGVSNQYNSAGGLNGSSNGGVGVYKVWIPGLGSTNYDGNLQVTASNSGAGVRCKVARWIPGTAGQTVYVLCHDAVGSPVNTDFNLSYHHKLSVIGTAWPPKLWGYIWDALGAVPPGANNVNSQGAVNTVVPAGTGLRMVTFPKVGQDPSHVQVTAEGSGPEFCNLLTSWAVFGSDALVRDVACYTAAGARIDQRSFVAYTSAY